MTSKFRHFEITQKSIRNISRSPFLCKCVEEKEDARLPQVLNLPSNFVRSAFGKSTFRKNVFAKSTFHAHQICHFFPIKKNKKSTYSLVYKNCIQIKALKKFFYWILLHNLARTVLLPSWRKNHVASEWFFRIELWAENNPQHRHTLLQFRKNLLNRTFCITKMSAMNVLRLMGSTSYGRSQMAAVGPFLEFGLLRY